MTLRLSPWEVARQPSGRLVSRVSRLAADAVDYRRFGTVQVSAWPRLRLAMRRIPRRLIDRAICDHSDGSRWLCPLRAGLAMYLASSRHSGLVAASPENSRRCQSKTSPIVSAVAARQPHLGVSRSPQCCTLSRIASGIDTSGSKYSQDTGRCLFGLTFSFALGFAFAVVFPGEG